MIKAINDDLLVLTTTVMEEDALIPYDDAIEDDNLHFPTITAMAAILAPGDKTEYNSPHPITMNSDDKFNPFLLLSMIDDDVVLLPPRTIEAELPAVCRNR